MVKLRLLASLEAISNSVKCQMLQPVLEALTNESTATRMASVLGTAYEDFVSLLLNTLDETAVGHLNKDENFWTTYKMVLRHFYQPGMDGLFFYISQTKRFQPSLLLRVKYSRSDCHLQYLLPSSMNVKWTSVGPC